MGNPMTSDLFESTRARFEVLRNEAAQAYDKAQRDVELARSSLTAWNEALHQIEVLGASTPNPAPAEPDPAIANLVDRHRGRDP